MTPHRVKRSRKSGWRKPANSVIVDRTSMWGNPFIVRESSLTRGTWHVFWQTEILFSGSKRDAQDEAVRLFGLWFNDEIVDSDTEVYRIRDKYGWKGFTLACAAPYVLRGKDLVCWCNLDDPCHADVILKLVNIEDV